VQALAAALLILLLLLPWLRILSISAWTDPRRSFDRQAVQFHRKAVPPGSLFPALRLERRACVHRRIIQVRSVALFIEILIIPLLLLRILS
jgi:hypothetical protein